MRVATDAQVRVLICPQGKKSIEASVENSPGLRIRVTPGGRTWRFDHRAIGKKNLGGYPAISLAEARRAAAEIRAEIERERVRDGWAELDIKVLQVAERRTLGDALSAYATVRGFAIRSWPAQRASILLRYGHLLDRPLASLRPDEILAPVRRDRNVASARAATHVCVVLRHAGRPDLAAPRAEVSLLVPERPRERVLSEGEIRAVWRALPELREPWPDAIPALLLTMARKSDLLGMTWSDVDLDAGEWRVKVAKTRGAARTELLPLSRQMIELIRSQPASSEFVFATARGTRFTAGFAPVELMVRFRG